MHIEGSCDKKESCGIMTRYVAEMKVVGEVFYTHYCLCAY